MVRIVTFCRQDAWNKNKTKVLTLVFALFPLLTGVSAGSYRYALMLGDKLMENSQVTEIGNLTVRPPPNMEPIPEVGNKFSKLPDFSPAPKAEDEPPPQW